MVLRRCGTNRLPHECHRHVCYTMVCQTRGPRTCARRVGGFFSKYIKLFGRSVHDLSLSGRVACLSADRDPRSGFAQVRLDDAPLCIKSHCPYFVVSLGEREGHTPRICRFLHLAELCNLQGVCPSSLPAGMKASQLRRALAHAMAVPSVGSAANAAMIARMVGSCRQICKRKRIT